MTQKTKLEIIGEYREDHPGPFCTRDGRPVRLLTKTDGHPNFPIVGFNGTEKTPTTWCANGRLIGNSRKDGWDLMCAREAPVAFECWVIVGEGKPVQMRAYPSAEVAGMMQTEIDGMKRLIHMREVLPGDEA